MSFIFPQNYNLKNKFLGTLDYSTLIINLIWIYFIFTISSYFIKSFFVHISFVIIFCLPLFLLSVFYLGNENLLNIIKYLLKYLFKPNLYIFYK